MLTSSYFSWKWYRIRSPSSYFCFILVDIGWEFHNSNIEEETSVFLLTKRDKFSHFRKIHSIKESQEAVYLYRGGLWRVNFLEKEDFSAT